MPLFLHFADGKGQMAARCVEGMETDAQSSVAAALPSLSGGDADVGAPK